MVLYLSIIAVFVIFISCLLIFCNLMAASPIIIIGLILGAVVCEFAIDGLLAGLVHVMPEKWFKVDNKFYHVSDKERKFYEKLKIRKWKDKVWELGGLGGFSKRDLKSSSDINYIKQFLIESNKGVLTHILGCFAGFLLIIIYLPFNCLLQISIPVSIINFLMNLPSLFILRYNTPKLMAGYKRLQRNQEKQQSKPSDADVAPKNETTEKASMPNTEPTEGNHPETEEKSETEQTENTETGASQGAHTEANDSANSPDSDQGSDAE